MDRPPKSLSASTTAVPAEARNVENDIRAGFALAKVYGNVNRTAPYSDPGAVLRYGMVADPKGGAAQVTLARVHYNDPDTDRPGAWRAWISDTTNLPAPAFTVRFGLWWSGSYDASNQATDTMGIWGMRDYSTAAQGPLFLRITGRRAEIVLQERVPIEVLYGWDVNEAAFSDLRVDCKPSTGPDGRVRIFHNGTLVVDHTGWNTIENNGQQLMRYGIYHWSEFGNDWDTRFQQRLVYFKGPYVEKWTP